MPRKKKSDQPEAPQKTTAKVRPELLRKARHVSSHKGVSLEAYIDGLLSGPIERDYRQFIADESKGL